MSEPGKRVALPSGELRPEEIAEFKRRAAELGTRIDGVQADKQAEIEAQQDRVNRGRGMAMGLRMSSEFVAAILVGSFMGYMLDRWLGTAPWMFLVFFLMGFAAGLVNLTRAFRQMQDTIKRETGGDIGQPLNDDDD
jgi:ATP synthase protein I